MEDVGSGKSKESKHKVKNYEKLKTLESRKSAMATKIESSDAIKFLKNSFILKTTEEPKEAAELIKSFGMIFFSLFYFVFFCAKCQMDIFR